MHEKDPFGDKLKDKERAEEDLYFAKRDREALEKLRRSGQPAPSAEGVHGRCPRDGEPLGRHTIEGVEVEECATCHGIWLDKGELDTLSRSDSQSWLGKLFRHSLVGTR